MFGAMHFIYYINRLITTKVYSGYLGYSSRVHNVYVWGRQGELIFEYCFLTMYYSVYLHNSNMAFNYYTKIIAVASMNTMILL